MKSTGPTSELVLQGIRAVRKAREKAPIWRYVYGQITKASRSRTVVNLSRIARYAQSGSTVVVPGKVLGAGSVGFPLTVVALSFSRSAVDKIHKAKGKALTFDEFLASRRTKKGLVILK